MSKKLILFYVIILGIIVMIILVVISAFLHNKTRPDQAVIPAPTIFQQQAQPVTPRDKAAPLTKDTEKIISRIQNRQTLSSQDLQAKNTLIQSLGQNQEVVYTSNAFEISYLEAGDFFMVEIRSSEIASAKSAAVEWLKSHGFTDQGLCDLPIQFYLNYSVLQDAEANHQQFSTVAPGC